jgi:hypothetical protein
MTRNHPDAGSREAPFNRETAASREREEEPALNPEMPAASEEELARHSVWDEPALAAAGTKAPENAFSRKRYYEKRITETGPLLSWGVTIGLMLAGGLFAVIGAVFATPSAGAAGILTFVLAAPIAEEMLKIGGPLMVLETRPWLFRSPAQILLAVLAGAAGFAIIENLLYLRLYIEDPSDAIWWWRWTVCTAMHTGASATAAMGLIRQWRQMRRHDGRIRLKAVSPYIILAIAMHGFYNFSVIAMEAWHGFPNSQ